MWRKTRKPYLGGLCRGADPNRNWDFHWMGEWISKKLCIVPSGLKNKDLYIFSAEGGASSNPCAEDFAGSEAFSEVETKSLADYLTRVSSNNNDIYIAFHSYSQLLMFPRGYTSQHAPLNDLWVSFIMQQTILKCNIFKLE